MNKIITYSFVFYISALYTTFSFAQSAGSSNTENSSRYVGGTRTTLAETLYIGPDAVIQIDGTWNIYSKYVWISPLAQISGNGNIVFHKPSDVDGTAGSTIIDGNNNLAIDVNIIHANNSGIEIKNVTLDPSLVAQNWADHTTLSTFKIGKDFNLSVDGADVWLDPTPGVVGDFVFDSDATISNYRPERMVISNNSIQSHMVKEDASNGFVFPVGISDGNYSPAQVSGSGTYHVSVQNYSSSISNETLMNGGPQRTWHIYADTQSTATISLQHNVSDEIRPFDSSSAHFVTQYSELGWSLGSEKSGIPGTLTTGASPLADASIQDRGSITIPNLSSAATSYFTKTNLVTLPVTLIAFNTQQEGHSAQLNWSTAEEIGTDRFEIEHSVDAINWITIGYHLAQGDSKKVVRYAFTHSAVRSGLNYYRLKMIDLNGSYTYSRMQHLDFDRSELKLTFYPNPVSDFLFIKDQDNRVIAPESIQGVTIYHLNGTVVFNEFPLKTDISKDGIDVRKLESGIYVVKIIRVDGSTNVQKIVIK